MSDNLLKKVQFVHFREMTVDKNGKRIPNPRGGATVCYLPTEGEYDQHLIGISITSPKENFERKEGRNRSQGRARSRKSENFLGHRTMDVPANHPQQKLQREIWLTNSQRNSPDTERDQHIRSDSNQHRILRTNDAHHLS